MGEISGVNAETVVSPVDKRLQREQQRLNWSSDRARQFEQNEQRREQQGEAPLDLLPLEENTTATKIYLGLENMGVRTITGVKEIMNTRKTPEDFGPKKMELLKAALERFDRELGTKSKEELQAIVTQQRERRLTGYLTAGMTKEELARFKQIEEERMAKGESIPIDALPPMQEPWRFEYALDNQALKRLQKTMGVKTVQGFREIMARGKRWQGVGRTTYFHLAEILKQAESFEGNQVGQPQSKG